MRILGFWEVSTQKEFDKFYHYCIVTFSHEGDAYERRGQKWLFY